MNAGRVPSAPRLGTVSRFETGTLLMIGARLVIVALLVLGAVGCSTAGPAESDSRVQALFGGADAYDIAAGNVSSGRIRTARVDGAAGATGDAGAGELGGYAVISEIHPVGDTEAAELGRILGDDATYDWEREKGCKFVPGVAIRWERRRTTVDVLLCFSCDELEIFVDDDVVGHEDFDSRRGDLVRVVKRLYPRDPEIQGLTE